MFVGHNFDSVKGYERSLKRGIEVMKWPTWRNLRQYIHYAGISEQQCFFTNALMGLQPDRSQGTLNVTPRFRDECLSFLYEQIDIVRPAAIVALGKVSTEHIFQVPRAVPKLALLHPRAATRRRELVAEMGNRLGAFITASGSGGVHP